jgi:hypothetical protein
MIACHSVMVITRQEQLAAAVGKLVTLDGIVENTRIASLVGVDVESDSPDLRGRSAVASGRLERVVVTKEELEEELAARGQFAHRGAGVSYRLVDPESGRLAHVRQK